MTRQEAEANYCAKLDAWQKTMLRREGSETEAWEEFLAAGRELDKHYATDKKEEA